VLTPEAVAKGLMPPLGQSALPASLEAAIPPTLRFWKAADAETARAVRDELVERAVVLPDDVLLVDGEARRVVWKAFLAEEDQADAPLLERSPPGIAAGLRLVFSEEPVRVIDVVDDPGAWTQERVQETIKNVGTAHPPLFVLQDTHEHRFALAKAGLTAFVMETRPGLLFGSTLPLDASARYVAPAPPPAVDGALSKALSGTTRLVRKAEEPAAEERFVFGVVLEPDVVDTQGDTYSAEEVRKAAHRFMELHGNLGQQHDAIVTGKLVILESYVAPVDFAVGTEAIKAGTWLLAIRVKDDGLWESIKAGGFTGFSIGGSAIRTPEPAPAA
jgi:hypothetical protein